MSKTNEEILPQSYYWNKAQSRLSFIAGGAFCAMACAAYVLGGSNQPDADELCAPENVACHEYVETQSFNSKAFLSGLFVLAGGVGFARSSRFYENAEKIKDNIQAPGITL